MCTHSLILFFTCRPTTAHLSALKFICQVSDHAANMFRSCCNFAASSSLEIVLYILVSSANNFTVDFSRAGNSFVYSKNSVGESSAPYGRGLLLI